MKRKPVAKTRSDGGVFSGNAQVDAALRELAKILSDIACNEQGSTRTQPEKEQPVPKGVSGHEATKENPARQRRGNDDIEVTKDVSFQC